MSARSSGRRRPVLVALFNNPITALWVMLLFVALQQLEGHVVAPAGVPHLAADQPDRR